VFVVLVQQVLRWFLWQVRPLDGSQVQVLPLVL
jgi:hypothetical protein